MNSMTGFGRGEVNVEGLSVCAEMRSVNNRFLDVSLKIPRSISHLEDKMREILREGLSRGHIDLFVTVVDRREKSRNYRLDLSAAEGYLNAAGALKEKFPSLLEDITISSLLRVSDVLSFEEESEKEDEELKLRVLEALRLALENLKQMKAREGERLKKEVVSHVERISSLREEISLRAPLIAENYRNKLLERMREFLGGKVDESRILLEAALFADKCNIDEELARLKSHIEEFYKICEEESVGRKLDFLIQEFNRECNTICSKSNDAQLTKSALEMKNEIEKIREQIQNLE